VTARTVRILGAALLLVGGCAPVAWDAGPPRAVTPRAPDAEPVAPYEALLRRAKARPADVDFTALRLAYARSADYAPYAAYPDQAAPMRQALEAQDWRAVVKIAEAALRANYVRMRPHAHAMRAHEALGNHAAAAHHRAMFDGLAASILASGNGRSPETAMIVIAIQEQYDALAVLGLRSVTQRLTSHAGRHLDAHTVVDGAGRQSSMFFDVSLPFARAPGR
jgi:Domain of unknown function (DUF4919)